MANYFQLFQLPVQLPVDMAALSDIYQQLQRQYHPDNFATASDNEKAAMLQKSTTINDGYQTLKNPIRAAEHLLALQGIDLNGEQNIIHDEDFLLEQFELREKLDEIEQNSELIDDFYAKIKQRKKQVYQTLLQALDNQEWLLAQQILYQIRYLDRLIAQIEIIQEQHDLY